MSLPQLFYCLDRAYLSCTLVSAYSALENSSRKLDIAFLVDGDDFANLPSLDKLAHHPNLNKFSVKQLDFSAEVEARIGAFPRAMMGRLLAGRYMTGRAIYLDGDTLVLGDVCELNNTNMEDFPVAAVRDTMMLSWLAKSTKGKLHRGPTYERILKDRTDLIPGFDAENYFNSGILVMDFERIEALGLRHAMENVSSLKRYSFPDQDHLNSVFAGQVAWLDPKWNGQWSNIETRRRYFDRGTRTEFSESRSRSSIMHYTGARKPWQPMTWHRFSRMLGIQQLPEMPAMLRMRSEYAVWHQRAAAFYGTDPFEQDGHTEARDTV